MQLSLIKGNSGPLPDLCRRSRFFWVRRDEIAKWKLLVCVFVVYGAYSVFVVVLAAKLLVDYGYSRQGDVAGTRGRNSSASWSHSCYDPV